MTLPTPGKLPPGAPCADVSCPLYNLTWHFPTPGKLPPNAPCANASCPQYNLAWLFQHQVNYHPVWSVTKLVVLNATWQTLRTPGKLPPGAPCVNASCPLYTLDMTLPTPSKLPHGVPWANISTLLYNLIWYSKHQVKYHPVCPVLVLVLLYATWYDTHNTR